MGAIDLKSLNSRTINDQIIKAVLRKFGWRFGSADPNDTFYDDDDTVEIFDLQGVQLFRNIKFLETCGYSLEHLFGYNYSELYETSEAHLKDFFSFFAKATSGKEIFLQKEHQCSHIMSMINF